jgi:hypothetical protein
VHSTEAVCFSVWNIENLWVKEASAVARKVKDKVNIELDVC